MSVATFDPTTDTASAQIRMTARAIAHARRQITAHGSRGLRLGVTKSGCSGYMYKVDLVDEPLASDQKFSVGDDVVIFVDSSTLPLVRGTEIDYVTEGLNSTLKFSNPNASAQCGCGESFAVEAAAPQGASGAA